MRNIFRKNVATKNSIEFADIQPRGVRHTISYRGEYNETWNYIHEEIKRTTLPAPDQLKVERHDIYSYEVKAAEATPEYKIEVEPVENAIQHCNTLTLTECSLTLSASKFKTRKDSASQIKEDSAIEINNDEKEVVTIETPSIVDRKVVEYALEAAEEAEISEEIEVTEEESEEIAPSNYQYESNTQEPILYSFFGETSTSSSYSSGDFVSPTSDGIYESPLDDQLSEKTKVAPSPGNKVNNQEYRGLSRKEDAAKKPSNNNKIQPKSAKDLHKKTSHNRSSAKQNTKRKNLSSVAISA